MSDAADSSMILSGDAPGFAPADALDLMGATRYSLDLTTTVATGSMDAVVIVGNDVAVTDPEPDLPIEDDVRADLEAAGLVVGDESAMAQAQRDAMAAIYLRRMGALGRELDRQAEAEKLEHEVITRHYGRLAAPLIRQLAAYEQQVEILAELSVATMGKKHSAETPWGSYGYRNQSATVELADRMAALSFAREHAPAFVKTKTTEDLAWSEWKKTLATLPPDQLPAGVVAVPARREFYAKPITVHMGLDTTTPNTPHTEDRA